jgi:hypothetical protein
LWEQAVPDFVPPNKTPQANLQDSWKLFYGYDIFTWRPDLLIDGWKPACVHCGKNEEVGPHQYDRDPRLVYGLKKNYLLNSPMQWGCRSCKKYFASRDPAVLNQLQQDYPGVRSLSPCEMGWRSAIDNELLELLFAAVDSGMGPSSVCSFVKNMHFHCFEECELRWLQMLCHRRKAPGPFDVRLSETIESLKMFPGYESEEVCGMVPSQSLLCDVYCKATATRTQRMDAMQQRRVRNSKLFCIDASYKVPKWLANIMGQPMYSTLITAINEYGESLASYFALSDNHAEIKSCLLQLRECGFNPELAFTDNVPRDDEFLQGCFPSLETETAATDEFDDMPELEERWGAHLHTDPNPAGRFPNLQLRSDPEYYHRSEDSIAALDLFEEKVLQKDDPVISFDLEWSVYHDGPRSQVSLITFASLEHDKCILIHLAKIKKKKELLDRISRLLSNKKIIFVGSNIRNDVTILKGDFPETNFCVPRTQDLGMLAVYCGLVPYKKGHYGLKPLTARVLQQRLPVEARIRTSDIWDQPGLLVLDAITYAARDVEAGVQIHSRIKGLPDLSKRLRKNQCIVGLDVDILPRRKTVVYPIASGKIIQIDGITATGIKLTSKRVLVEVTAVYKPESGLIFTQVGTAKCKCGSDSHRRGNSRRCNLRTFRDAQKLSPDSFIIVEEYDRLRPMVESGLGSGVLGENNAIFVGTSAGSTEDLITEEEQDAGERLSGALAAEDEGEDIDGSLELNLPENIIEELDQLLDNHDDDSENDTMNYLPSNSLLAIENMENPLANATVNQVALEKAAREIVAAIIADADKMAASQQQGNTVPLNHVEDGLVALGPEAINHLEEDIRRVLGDAFHVMDRVHVPVHHDWKAAYFAALREAIFM